MTNADLHTQSAIEPEDSSAASSDETASSRAAPWLVVGSAAALAACNGSSGTSDAEVAARAQPVTDQAASRFLSQAAWGGNDAAIAEVRALGYEGWLTRQFTTQGSQSHFDWMIAKGFVRSDLMFNPLGLDRSIWRKLMTSPDALRQRIVLALSEILVVSINGLPVPYSGFVAAGYLDLLEKHCFGNFRDLLEAVTLSPAMGIYLSMMGSQGEDPASGRMPDENYAREVMQLFTIGLYQLNPDGSLRLSSKKPVETYDQASVMGLAKVFTGWEMAPLAENIEVGRTPMVFNAANHSRSSKSFLGVTVPAATTGPKALKIALDTLFKHANVGPFIGRQLIQRLVTSNPSPAYVRRVTNAFNNNGRGVRGDLKAVIKAVLLDAEARAAPVSTTQGKLREPMVRLVQWARTFPVTASNDTWGLADLSDPATRLAQSPMHSRSVFNFFRPDFKPANAILPYPGLVAPEMQITHEASVTAYLNVMQYVISEGADDVRADYRREMELADSAPQLVNRCNLLLAAGQLSPASVSLISTAIASMPVSNDAERKNRVCAAIFMVMASPEYLVLK